MIPAEIGKQYYADFRRLLGMDDKDTVVGKLIVDPSLKPVFQGVGFWTRFALMFAGSIFPRLIQAVLSGFNYALGRLKQINFTYGKTKAEPVESAEATVKRGNTAARRLLAVLGGGALLVAAAGLASLCVSPDQKALLLQNLMNFLGTIEPFLLSALTGGAVNGLADYLGQRMSDRPERSWKQTMWSALIGMTFGIQVQVTFTAIDWAAPLAGWSRSGLLRLLGMKVTGFEWAIRPIRTLMSLSTAVLMLEYWVITHIFGRNLPGHDFKSDSRKFVDFFIFKTPIAVAFNFVLQNLLPMSITLLSIAMPLRTGLLLLYDGVFNTLQAWVFNTSHPPRYYVFRFFARLFGRRAPSLIQRPTLFKNLPAGGEEQAAAWNRLAWEARHMNPNQFRDLLIKLNRAIAE